MKDPHHPMWTLLLLLVFVVGVGTIEALHANHVDSDEFHRSFWIASLAILGVMAKAILNRLKGRPK